MGERAKTTREILAEFDTPEWRAADTWVWRNAPHGGTRYQDAKLRYQTAVARIAELEVQIRGHCALLTGGTTHTENPTDCLGQVQEFIATLAAERDEAVALLRETAATDMAQLWSMRQRGVRLPAQADALLDRVEPLLHETNSS